MKFIFLSVLFILLVFSNAQAQRKNYDRQHITGVFVGLSFSKFTERVGPFAYGSSNTYDNASSFGFNGAIFHKKNYNNQFTTHLELGFLSKGGGASAPNGDLVFTNNGAEESHDRKVYQLNYLEAPLLIGVRIKGNFINFGISPALLVAQNFVDTFDDAEQKKTRIDLARRFNANIILDYNHMSSSDYPLYLLFRLFYSPISPFKEHEIDGYNFKTQSFGGTLGLGITF